MAYMASCCALLSSCCPFQTLTICLWEVDRTSLGSGSEITYVHSFCVMSLTCHPFMMVCLVTSMLMAATSSMSEMPYQDRPAYTLDTLRMFDFGGGAAPALYLSSVQPQQSACILKRELMSACNHISTPTHINVALANGSLEAHTGLSDSLAWPTTSAQEWVTKLWSTLIAALVIVHLLHVVAVRPYSVSC